MRHLLCGILPLVLVAGCSSVATRKAFHEPITAELRSGNLEAAVLALESARERKKYAQKDRLLYFIDAGALNHYAGHYETSNEKLHLADAAAEELFTKSISRAAASMLLNDNVLEYSGEDYEVLYANLISALNYMALGMFDDAFVEIRRANLKLEQLEQKYADAAADLQRPPPDDSEWVKVPYEIKKVRFHNDAFARYLSMHMYAADGKWDDARIDYDYLVSAFRNQPHIYDFAPPDVLYRSDDGGILSVVGLVGLAPEKEATSFRIRTDKDLDLVQVMYDDPGMEGAEYGHWPVEVSEDYYFKFAIPSLVPRPTQIGSIRVLADGAIVGELMLIEDVGRVASETFAAKKSLVFFRSLARALVKGLAAHKLKKKADTGGLAGWLKKAAIDVGTDISENADLRSTQYLPGRIYVGDFVLEPGPHDITIECYGVDGHLAETAHFPAFVVSNGGLNLIEVHTAR